MELIYWEILGIAAALVFSAFFSASETALTSLPRVKLQQILDSRRFWGRSLVLWQVHPNRVLITILIGNNVANITASVLATDLATRLFPERGIAIAIGAMTFLLLVTGEITPKTLARTFPTVVALPTMSIVSLFYVLLFPISWVLTWFIRGLISLMGGGRDESALVTERDLEYLVHMGATDGTIDKDQETLFKSVIEFPDTLAKEIMTPRTDLVAVPLDSSFGAVVDAAIDSGFSRIPVYDQSIDKIVGIFFAKHLLSHPTGDEQKNFLTQRMRSPVFVPESKKIGELLKLFQEQSTHLAVVVDEFGGTEGIVTLEDVIEELLGDIQDEFDVQEPRLVELPDGGFMADARVDIEDLETALRLEFPEERDYESLGGFLMEAAGNVPREGWSHEYAGYTFSVTQADANRVITVKIEKCAAPEEDAEPPEEKSQADTAS